jgi:hypothetical protein
MEEGMAERRKTEKEETNIQAKIKKRAKYEIRR